MAGAAEDAENFVILAILLVLLAAVAYVIWEFRSFFGFGQDQGGDGGGQSFANALNGFPDGADPGTVPAAQYVQGLIESARNYGAYQAEPSFPEETMNLSSDGAAAYSLNTTLLPLGMPDAPLPNGGIDPGPAVTAIEQWMRDNRFF